MVYLIASLVVLSPVISLAVLGVIPRMVIITETESYLHAEATSLIFRFRDDVEFVIDQQANVIHFRSASRVGHSDLGANRVRMEEIRKAFKHQEQHSNFLQMKT